MNQTTKILLIVSGGIAAYKSAHVIREFRRRGDEVRVVMTKSAEEFITPMTLQVLSENRVGRGLFEPGFEYEIGHIETARWPDIIVVAPATANIMAKAYHGLADDLPTTVLLASTAPVLFCPAMNTQMYLHAATQSNMQGLAERENIELLEPDAGELACKEVGPGRLPDPEVIVDKVDQMLVRKSDESSATLNVLAGKKVVVTAGPTQEYFDPVRFISNPSTGRMGYAVARAFAEAGAETLLISGPTSLPEPEGVAYCQVMTAEEMREEVFKQSCDIVIMAAAVADYRPVQSHSQKRKKSEDGWAPEFERTPDILHQLSTSQQRPDILVGFAAETEDVEQNARDKLTRKSLDGIVANCVAGQDSAFGSCSNEVILLGRKTPRQKLPRASKNEIAQQIVHWVATDLHLQQESE